MPHQPGADHAVAGIDEEAHVAELAQHEMPARGECVHDDPAQQRPSDQNGLEHCLAQCAAAAPIRSSDLSPGRNLGQADAPSSRAGANAPKTNIPVLSLQDRFGRAIRPWPSVADLTFLPSLPRVIRRNVKSKATLESYGC